MISARKAKQKSRRLPFSFLVFFIVSGAIAQNGSKTFGEFVYDVPVNSASVHLQSGMQYWHSYVDADLWTKFYNELYRAVGNGKLPATVPGHSDSVLPVEVARTKLLLINEIQIEDYNGVYASTYIDSIKPEAGFSIFLRFNEMWTFNENDNVLTKTVKGVTIGYNTDEVIKLLLYIPFDNKNSDPASSVVLKGVNYSDVRLSDFGQDVRYHYFTNALMKYAGKNPSGFRDTLFPFTRISNLTPSQIKDSVFHSYKFGCYEDWILNIQERTFQKKVHAMVFSKSHPKRGTRKVAAYVFKGFEPFQPFDPQPQLTNVNSFTRYYIEDDTVPEFITIAKSFRKMQSAIDSAVLSNQVKTYRDNDLYTMMDRKKYTEQMQYEIIMPGYDTLGNEYVDTIYETILINSVGFSKDIQLDLASQKLTNRNKTAEYRSWNDSKGIFMLLFFADADKTCKKTPVKLGENIQSTILFSQSESPTEAVVCGNSYEIFNQYFQETSVTQRYKFVYSIVQSAMDGKIQLYKPGTDSVMTKSDLLQLNDRNFYPCLKENILPAWPLAVSKLELIEDLWYCPETMQWTSEIKQITFIQAQYAERLEKKLFTLKIKK